MRPSWAGRPCHKKCSRFIYRSKSVTAASASRALRCAACSTRLEKVWEAGCSKPAREAEPLHRMRSGRASASGPSGSGTGVAKAMPCQEPSRSTNTRIHPPACAACGWIRQRMNIRAHALRSTPFALGHIISGATIVAKSFVPWPCIGVLFNSEIPKYPSPSSSFHVSCSTPPEVSAPDAMFKKELPFLRFALLCFSPVEPERNCCCEAAYCDLR